MVDSGCISFRTKKFKFDNVLPEKANVGLRVYDITGKIVKVIRKAETAGYYSGKIDMTGVSAGVYFIRIEANENRFSKTKKVLLVK